MLSVRTRKVKSRVAGALRMAAYTLSRSHSALGDYYRRIRARLGAPKAVTAAAHKLARIIHHLLTTGQEYDESVFAQSEQQHRRRRARRLEREAVALGYSLVPREHMVQPVSWEPPRWEGLRWPAGWLTLPLMTTPENIGSLNREQLLDLVERLQRQLNDLQARNQDLQAEVERLTRQRKRQAAPFSRGTRSQQPKRPGRKPGKGTFSFRKAPHPEEVTEPPVNVPVNRESCPGCGGKLRERRVDFAYVTELPPLPKPRVTQYRVWVCRCTGCGRQVRGEHPELATDQYGATAHRLGPRAMAIAHALHYQVGVPVRKVPLVLSLLTGMTLTQGAITRDALRRGRGIMGQKYQELRAGVRDSPVVYTDDTGWKVDGENAQLMAFDTDQATVYQVRSRHRHQEVQEIVPRNYQGVMVTDRGRSYEDRSFRRVKQQKCLAHLQRTLSEVLSHKKGRARDLAEGARELLRFGVRLWGEYHWGSRARFHRWEPEVRWALSYHLRDRPLKDPDNQKLLRMLRRYHQRGDLLRFLEQPEVEPTNNRVERKLRPAVIAHKVSQRSKNNEGAYTFSAFKSIVQTLVKRGG